METTPGAIPLSLPEVMTRYKALELALDRQRKVVVLTESDLRAKYSALETQMREGLDGILAQLHARQNWLLRVLGGAEPTPEDGTDAVFVELGEVRGHIAAHATRRSEIWDTLISRFTQESRNLPPQPPAFSPQPPSSPITGAFTAPPGPASGWYEYSPPQVDSPAGPSYPTAAFGDGPLTGAYHQYAPASAEGPVQDDTHSRQKRGRTSRSRRPVLIDDTTKVGTVIPSVKPPQVRAARKLGGWLGRSGLIGTVLAIVVMVCLATTLLRGGGPSYPASVSQVKTWAAAACKDPNTAVPGAPQFACADGQNILWVLAYLTSGDNPNYVGKPPQKGAQPRQGLLPVPLAEAQQYAIALRLTHAFHWNDPEDSLKVGALILNAFVDGTAAQPTAGLESSASNCARYTGEAKTTNLNGVVVCHSQNLTDQGKIALVHDLYLKWATTQGAKVDQSVLNTAANAAMVLFANPDSPGNKNAQAALAWIEKNHAKLLV